MASLPAAKSESNEHSTYRLVIRARIIPDPPPEPRVEPRSPKQAVALLGGTVALLALIWIAVAVFKTESTVAPRTQVVSRPLTQSSASNPSAVPPSTQSASDSDASSAAPTTAPRVEIDAPAAKRAASKAANKTETMLAPINKAIPEPSQSALQTIRGTIRVTVRMTVDKQGAVSAVNSVEPGPSRYFERKSIEAARRWTFAPTTAEKERSVQVRFQFTRDGATAHEMSLPR